MTEYEFNSIIFIRRFNENIYIKIQYNIKGLNFILAAMVFWEKLLENQIAIFSSYLEL